MWRGLDSENQIWDRFDHGPPGCQTETLAIQNPAREPDMDSVALLTAPNQPPFRICCWDHSDWSHENGHHRRVLCWRGSQEVKIRDCSTR